MKAEEREKAAVDLQAVVEGSKREFVELTGMLEALYRRSLSPYADITFEILTNHWGLHFVANSSPS